MKKLVCFVLATLLASAVFAEKTKVHGIGLALPIESQYWWNDDVLKDQTFSSFGLNIDYKNMSVHGDSFVGFSAIYEMQFGYFWGSTDFSDYDWFDLMNFKWGWGVAFRPTDKIILATHGTLGFDFKLLWNHDDPPFPDFTTRLGWDFEFVYKCNDKFGISAGFDTYVPIIGVGLDYYKVYDESYKKGYKKENEVYTIYGGIGCDFKFGVCWVY